MSLLLLVALLLPSVQGHTTTPVDAPSHSQVQPIQCEEDEPCFDCETMGNGTCGTATTSAVVNDGTILEFIGTSVEKPENDITRVSVQTELDPGVWYTFSKSWSC